MRDEYACHALDASQIGHGLRELVAASPDYMLVKSLETERELLLVLKLGHDTCANTIGRQMSIVSLGHRVLQLPRSAKRLLALLTDSLLCLLAVWLAFGLRLDDWSPLGGVEWIPVVVSLVIAIPLFAVTGFYRAIFRYAGWTAIMTVAKVMLLYGFLFAMVFAVVRVEGVPRTIGILQPMLLFFLVGGIRLGIRYWLGGLYHRAIQRERLPRVLIFGAGSAGRQLAAALANSREMLAVGFIDDDATLIGNTINGIPVYGADKVKGMVDRLQITDVLLAIPSVSRARRNEILAELRKLPVHVRTLPGFLDLAYGRIHLSDLRELDIEDLLGRDAVAPNGILLNKDIRGKIVLVTGAGGSIGSELCRQITSAAPAVLLLVEITEYALYAVHEELKTKLLTIGAQELRLVPLLASVGDRRRMDEIFRTWRPHTVYHAAAYKHVPLVEHNPGEGIRNNVFGTMTAAQSAIEHGVANFVLVSTDKAVRPTNIMGASKRLAEMVLQGLAQAAAYGQTRFSMVRFGNVLGSSGSVVPKFRQQVKDGGPITLTHADITRYFMTIPEAAQLVIQAGAMATGGDVFVLDMGQPVRIVDLARRVVELSGLTVKDSDNPSGDIEIVVTGLRPGEKLYEELLIGENPEPTQHPRIMKAHEECCDWKDLATELCALEEALGKNNVPHVRSILQRLVSGYQTSAEVVDWVHLENRRGASADTGRSDYVA